MHPRSRLVCEPLSTFHAVNSSSLKMLPLHSNLSCCHFQECPCHQTPNAVPQRIPIAHRTRACLASPQPSSLVKLVQYHIPTAKTTQPQATKSDQFAGLCEALTLSTPDVIEFAGLCEKLTILDNRDALAVFDHEMGKLVEHCQLRKDPYYKKVWDRSYTNELGCLCQGIGTGDKAGGKRVAGINTFHIIAYANILHHK